MINNSRYFRYFENYLISCRFKKGNSSRDINFSVYNQKLILKISELMEACKIFNEKVLNGSQVVKEVTIDLIDGNILQEKTTIETEKVSKEMYKCFQELKKLCEKMNLIYIENKCFSKKFNRDVIPRDKFCKGKIDFKEFAIIEKFLSLFQRNILQELEKGKVVSSEKEIPKPKFKEYNYEIRQQCQEFLGSSNIIFNDKKIRISDYLKNEKVISELISFLDCCNMLPKKSDIQRIIIDLNNYEYILREKCWYEQDKEDTPPSEEMRKYFEKLRNLCLKKDIKSICVESKMFSRILEKCSKDSININFFEEKIDFEKFAIEKFISLFQWDNYETRQQCQEFVRSSNIIFNDKKIRISDYLKIDELISELISFLYCCNMLPKNSDIQRIIIDLNNYGYILKIKYPDEQKEKIKPTSKEIYKYFKYLRNLYLKANIKLICVESKKIKILKKSDKNNFNDKGIQIFRNNKESNSSLVEEHTCYGNPQEAYACMSCSLAIAAALIIYYKFNNKQFITEEELNECIKAGNKEYFRLVPEADDFLNTDKHRIFKDPSEFGYLIRGQKFIDGKSFFSNGTRKTDDPNIKEPLEDFLNKIIKKGLNEKVCMIGELNLDETYSFALKIEKNPEKNKFLIGFADSHGYFGRDDVNESCYIEFLGKKQEKVISALLNFLRKKELFKGKGTWRFCELVFKN